MKRLAAHRYLAVKTLTALCALAISCAAVQARTITDNNGGYIADFITALDDMRTRKELLEILGQCASACTLYLAAEKVCIGDRTEFWFHSPRNRNGDTSPQAKIDTEFARRLMMVIYPTWVRDWITANGGLTPNWAIMKADYAKRYLPTCGQEQPSVTPATGFPDLRFLDTIRVPIPRKKPELVVQQENKGDILVATAPLVEPALTTTKRRTKGNYRSQYEKRRYPRTIR